MRAQYFLITIAFLALTQICPAGIILNPGFETPVVGTSQVFTPTQTIGDWTVSGIDGPLHNYQVLTDPLADTASVTLVNNGYTEVYWNGTANVTANFHAHSGLNSLDITGYNNSNEISAPGGVFQTVGLCAGCQYTLTFWVGNMYDTFNTPSYKEPASVQLLINDVAAGTFTNSDNTVVNDYTWKQFTYTFTASSASTKIAFVNATPGGNASPTGFGRASGLDDVDLAIIATPEPSTWLMLAGGLGLFGWTRRRR